MRKVLLILIVVLTGICFIVWDVYENKKSETAANAPLKNAAQSVATLPNQDEVPSEITFDNGSGKSINVPIASIPELDKLFS